MPIFRALNRNFFKKWTQEMAYVLGFFAADGYITVNKRGGQFWSIQITDKELLYRIREALGAEHKISKRPGKGNNKTQYRLQIGSIEMCNDLRKIGFFEQKTKSMSVPDIPDKHFADFTRGYFDGDGNMWAGLLHKERKIQTPTLFIAFTSCSVPFLSELKKKLSTFCCGGCIYRSKRNYARLQYSSQDSLKLYDFMYNHCNYKRSGLFLERKRQVLQKYQKLKMRP